MQSIETANSEEENTGGGEEAEMSDMVLASTFLGGVTGAALGSFLTAGRAVPVFGKVFSLLLDIKEHCQTYQEFKRMAVWCVSLMAVFGQLANETTGEENSEQMLENTASALKKVRNLIIKRTQTSKGLLGKSAAFWTSAESLQSDKDCLGLAGEGNSGDFTKGLDITKVDVTTVLSKVEILPRMNESLNVLNDKMDRIQNSIGGIRYIYSYIHI
eukprot:CAMPEP_0173098144 /NCGR_PEP_ID=MMETSP1102-20130122/34498_1 /TAXON_ID=49646 /ORGANISM="Geminigera sp., Strain Caron Lab Isolate" /LENGTH=214 /DNA_ID=CAMNT_0013990469 /DNA_START=236 /DNA_END=879 /DNA_ORIENTATION=-